MRYLSENVKNFSLNLSYNSLGANCENLKFLVLKGIKKLPNNL